MLRTQFAKSFHCRTADVAAVDLTLTLAFAMYADKISFLGKISYWKAERLEEGDMGAIVQVAAMPMGDTEWAIMKSLLEMAGQKKMLLSITLEEVQESDFIL